MIAPSPFWKERSMIDLSAGVFSCFGSHLSVFAMHENAQNANRGKTVDKNTGRVLSDVGLTPGFYFRNFIHRRDYETNLFAIETPLCENRCPRYTCTPEMLDIREPDGFELCYASAGTLLLQTACPLRIVCRHLSGEAANTQGAFTLFDKINHYGLCISAVTGVLRATLAGTCVTLDLDAGCEIRIDESYDPVVRLAAVPSFYECVHAQRLDYERFLQKLPKALPGDEKLMELAAYGLWSAMAFARGNYQRDCMLVSKNYMCGMWSWDHCFAALALAYVSPERAWDQLMCMFDSQRGDGRIADCIEAVKTVWDYVKPPIHGLTLRLLKQSIKLTPAQQREAYDRLSGWTMFWLNERDMKGDGLPEYLHGNDSGWDNNTVFDRPGGIQSAELPAYLILMIQELEILAKELDAPALPLWQKREERLKAAMLKELFADGVPIARLADTHERVGMYSSLPYMAITLGEELPWAFRQKMLRKLDDPCFLTPYGIASEALNSPWYQPDGYSRGSIWSYGQFLPVVGLMRMKETEKARKIMNGFLTCCRKGGFSECFSSKDGSGQRDRFLNWSVCVYVLFTAWLQEEQPQ